MKKVFTMKSLVAVAAVAACGFGLAACGDQGEKVYKIGVSGPLSGDYAIYGNAVKNSAQLAIDEINAKGGFNGYKFVLTALDDVAEPKNAGQNYLTLQEKGMQVSLGAVTTGACLEYARYAKEDNVFCLTPSATGDGVPQVGDNMYQMCFSDSGQGAGAAEYVKANYPTAKVGVLYDSSNAYSDGIYKTFKEAYGKEPDVVTTFTKDTNTDFASQVGLLKDCDFIFLPIYYQEASLFITQAKSVLKNDAVYFGCDGLDGIAGVAGFDVNSFKQEISYLSHFNSSAEDENTKHYVEEYKKQYGEASLNQFGASAYDCVYAIYNAMVAAKAAGKDIPVNITASKLCDILKETFQGGFTFTGVTGQNIRWSADGTVAKTPTKYVVNPNRAA